VGAAHQGRGHQDRIGVSPRLHRFLIHAAGFVAGGLAVALWLQPWSQGMKLGPYLWTFIGAIVGIIVVEPVRRRIPSQDALDRAEEDSLSEQTMARLRAIRWIVSLAAVAFALVFMNLAITGDGSLEVRVIVSILAVFVGLMGGELLLTFDRRQALYTRRMSRRRWGWPAQK
jgi:hypothetical protein